jgi:hypothetical protein
MRSPRGANVSSRTHRGGPRPRRHRERATLGNTDFPRRSARRRSPAGAGLRGEKTGRAPPSSRARNSSQTVFCRGVNAESSRATSGAREILRGGGRVVRVRAARRLAPRRAHRGGPRRRAARRAGEAFEGGECTSSGRACLSSPGPAKEGQRGGASCTSRAPAPRRAHRGRARPPGDRPRRRDARIRLGATSRPPARRAGSSSGATSPGVSRWCGRRRRSPDASRWASSSPAPRARDFGEHRFSEALGAAALGPIDRTDGRSTTRTRTAPGTGTGGREALGALLFSLTRDASSTWSVSSTAQGRCPRFFEAREHVIAWSRSRRSSPGPCVRPRPWLSSCRLASPLSLVGRLNLGCLRRLASPVSLLLIPLL